MVRKSENTKNYTRNMVLEERGFTPVIFSGFINSSPEITISEKTNYVFYKIYIDDCPMWLWAKDFTFRNDLKEALKVGAYAEIHGDQVKINDTKFNNIIGNWEMWEKEISK